MGCDQKARELVESIKATPEYEELRQLKAEISKNRSLMSEMENFTKKQRELYGSRLSMKEMEAKGAELKKKFDELSKIPVVGRYLKVSGSFNEMLSKVFNIINESIENGLKV